MELWEFVYALECNLLYLFGKYLSPFCALSFHLFLSFEEDWPWANICAHFPLLYMWNICHSMARYVVCRSVPRIWTCKSQAAKVEHATLTTVPPCQPCLFPVWWCYVNHRCFKMWCNPIYPFFFFFFACAFVVVRKKVCLRHVMKIWLLLSPFGKCFISCSIFLLQNFYLVLLPISISLLIFSILWGVIPILSLNSLDVASFSSLKIFKIAYWKSLSNEYNNLDFLRDSFHWFFSFLLHGGCTSLFPCKWYSILLKIGYFK